MNWCLSLILFINIFNPKPKEMSFYDFKMKTIEGKEISLSEFKGKKVLVVNVASECGFTPQYEDLQNLWSK